jgi:hypothetical protein
MVLGRAIKGSNFRDISKFPFSRNMFDVIAMMDVS